MKRLLRIVILWLSVAVLLNKVDIAYGVDDDQLEDIIEKEAADRRERRIRLQALVDEGLEAYYHEKAYAKAIEKFIEAEKMIKTVFPGYSKDPRYKNLGEWLAMSYEAFGRSTYDDLKRILKQPLSPNENPEKHIEKLLEGYDNTIAALQKVSEYNPRRKRDIEGEIRRIRAEKKRVITEERVRVHHIILNYPALKEELKKLVLEIETLIKEGLYNDAKDKLDELKIKAIHHPRIPAFERIITKKVASTLERSGDYIRRMMSNAVEATWVTTPSQRTFINRDGSNERLPSTLVPKDESTDELENNVLKKLRIDEIDFENTTFKSAIQSLTRKLELTLPNQRINIIRIPGPYDNVEIDLSLIDVTLVDLLDQIIDVLPARQDIRYGYRIINKNTIRIGPRSRLWSKKDLIERNYRIRINDLLAPLGLSTPTSFGGEDQRDNNRGGDPFFDDEDDIAPPQQQRPDQPSPGGNGQRISNISRVFTQYFELELPVGHRILYLDAKNMLKVRTTPEQHQELQVLIDDLQPRNYQVIIQAKFMEVTETVLREMGVRWALRQGATLVERGSFTVELEPDGGTSSLGGGVRIDPFNENSGQSILSLNLYGLRFNATQLGFNALIQALSSVEETDILSSPKITVLDKTEATFSISETRRFPESWTQPDIDSNGNFTPSTPNFGPPQNIGISLTVKPFISTDFKEVRLTLNPEITEFVGFDDYSYNLTLAGRGDQPPREVVAPVRTPIISRRILSTEVVVADGEHLILGGMITNRRQRYEGKIPILGDLPFLGYLFRNKAYRNNKRNLLIFLTAHVVDSAGNPVNSRKASKLPNLVGEPPQ